MTSLTFIIPVVVFYALIFLVKFYYPKKDELQSPAFISISKKLDRTQIGLVMLSLGAGIAQLLENENITFRDCVEVGLTSAMILVAEVALAIIICILEWLKK
ncbi:hypothetical protein HB364_25885 [Pseudoflavitalea sp. X16]|uniref:hypothetical protein n=1 Tax=Paraflavitalea devenefica TaxID=2716334 RepID=UPI001424A483|nr:hypothetical protein [Paraflavitalea devenefica]NII28541.1 hypothetical protein [Paraflavitalea devenefica]